MAVESEGEESDADGALSDVADVSGRMVAAIIVVVAVALLVSLVVLLGSSGRAALGPSRPLAAPPDTTASANSTATSTTEVEPTTTTTPASLPDTSLPDTTLPGTSIVSTLPTLPTDTVGADLPGGWIEYRSPRDQFVVELPGEPIVTHEPDTAGTGARRTGYSVAGPAKSKIAIEVTGVGPKLDPDRYLATVITLAAQQLGATASVVDAPFDIAGGRAQDAGLTVPGGKFLMRAEYAGGSLHIVSIAVPSSAVADTAVANTFRRIVDSYSASA